MDLGWTFVLWPGNLRAGVGAPKISTKMSAFEALSSNLEAGPCGGQRAVARKILTKMNAFEVFFSNLEAGPWRGSGFGASGKIICYSE